MSDSNNNTPQKKSPDKSRRPIMILLDLLGRRWVLRILWELRDGPLTSRALRTACDDISPSVLQKRVNELRQADFISLKEGDGYALTDHGRDLLDTFGPLTKWAEDWQNSLR